MLNAGRAGQRGPSKRDACAEMSAGAIASRANWRTASRSSVAIRAVAVSSVTCGMMPEQLSRPVDYVFGLGSLRSAKNWATS
jgi:hypothetical protein